MKVKILLTVVASLLVGFLFAQTDNAEKKVGVLNHPNHILFSPLYFFNGTFMLTYERLFPSGSLRISPSVKLQHIDDYRFTQKEGLGIDLGYKFFLTKRPFRVNFYLGPYALYKSVKVKKAVDKHSSIKTYNTDIYDVVGLGVDTGVKFIFGRFTMDVMAGGGIRYAYLNGRSFDSSYALWYDVDYKGIVPRINLSLGAAF